MPLAAWITLAHLPSRPLPFPHLIAPPTPQTGIGLVHVCNSRGYKCVIYMPNTQSQEKMDLLRALGADVRPVPVAPITDPGNFNNQARDYAASLTNGGVPPFPLSALPSLLVAAFVAIVSVVVIPMRRPSCASNLRA